MEKIVRINKFSDFIGKSDDDILNNVCYAIYIDDTELFYNHLDLFYKLIETGKYYYFYSYDLDVLKLIETMLPETEKNSTKYKLALLDDMENKDRSYIDLDYFKKATIVLPISYVFWNLDIKDDINIYCYIDKKTFFPINIFGYEKIKLADFIKLKNIIQILSNECNNCTDIEKLMIISNYLQRHVQFVGEKNISESANKTYITDSKDVDVNVFNVRNIPNVLFNHFGVCEGIANASTILLNNSLMNVNVRSVIGSGHSWNIILIGGKWYHFDNTWAITRNPNRFSESLKAAKFDSNFLLFGDDKASNLSHHISESFTPVIELYDYPQEELEKSKKRLSKTIDFDHYNPPVFPSRIK